MSFRFISLKNFYRKKKVPFKVPSPKIPLYHSNLMICEENWKVNVHIDTNGIYHLKFSFSDGSKMPFKVLCSKKIIALVEKCDGSKVIFLVSGTWNCNLKLYEKPYFKCMTQMAFRQKLTFPILLTYHLFQIKKDFRVE